MEILQARRTAVLSPRNYKLSRTNRVGLRIRGGAGVSEFWKPRCDGNMLDERIKAMNN